MLRYPKLYLSFMRICLIREMEARGNFLSSCFLVFCYPIFPLMLIGAIYSQTKSLAGWNIYEYLVLVGTFQIIGGIIQTVFFKNLFEFNEYIRKGELDFFLLKPVSSQFMISTRYVSFAELSQVIPGLAMLLIGLANLNAPIELWRWPAYLLFMVCGVIICYSLWFIMVVPCIWVVRLETQGIFQAIFEMGRYHPNTFSGIVRTIFIWLLPIGLIAATPAGVLLGRDDWGIALWMVAVAVLLLFLSTRLWKFAQSRYYGASS